MASLDELEGDVIEAIGLILLIAVAILAFGIWKGISGFKFPDLSAISRWFKNLAEAFKQASQNPGSGTFDYSWPSPGELQGGGSDWVMTGGSAGNWDTPPPGDLEGMQ